MDRIFKNYEVLRFGRRIEVWLEYDEYDAFHSLAAFLYFKPAIMNEPIYDVTDSEWMPSGLELFAAITINLPESAHLPYGTQFVDVNNYPWIDEWLIENSIATPTGIIAKSGFCIYPAFKFGL